MAKFAKRLASNAEGEFYVDSSCIDCGTCRWMAPQTFDAHEGYARVYEQPGDHAKTVAASKALVACPTASIGTHPKREISGVAAMFPDLIADNVYHCGFHHPDSFGATSYLILRPSGNVLVDSPRYTPQLAKRIEDLGGVSMMFLTHRDDVADHEKFARRFVCERVLHRDDVTHSTRGVERQPHVTEPIRLDDELLMIPVPGHTTGSACLLYDNRFLFTGDHLAWSVPLRRLYAFRDACWYDWETQIQSMRLLAEHDFERVLPGHSAPCHFPVDEMRRRMQRCVAWMALAR